MSQTGYRRRRQSQGLRAQMQQVILHPVAFFKGLSQETPETRTWLWAALLILVLVGYATVQSGDVSTASGVPVSTTAITPTNTNNVQADLVTGLTAAALLVVAWLAQATLMIPIRLINQKPPQFARQLKIAIWASVPLALIALLRLALFAIGLESGYQGISGIFVRYPDLWNWENLSPPMQIFILQIASHLTIFSLWNAILLYLGIKDGIACSRWSAWLFLAMWIIALLLIPTVFESVFADPTAQTSAF